MTVKRLALAITSSCAEAAIGEIAPVNAIRLFTNHLDRVVAGEDPTPDRVPFGTNTSPEFLRLEVV